MTCGAVWQTIEADEKGERSEERRDGQYPYEHEINGKARAGRATYISASSLGAAAGRRGKSHNTSRKYHHAARRNYVGGALDRNIVGYQRYISSRGVRYITVPSTVLNHSTILTAKLGGSLRTFAEVGYPSRTPESLPPRADNQEMQRLACSRLYGVRCSAVSGTPWVVVNREAYPCRLSTLLPRAPIGEDQGCIMVRVSSTSLRPCPSVLLSSAGFSQVVS